MYNGGEGGGVLDNFIKLVVGDRAAFQLLQVLLFSPSFSVGVYGMGRKADIMSHFMEMAMLSGVQIGRGLYVCIYRYIW